MGTHLTRRLVELESEILYQEPPQYGKPDFLYLEGKIPILLSAPHGALHTRDGTLKEEDEYTAAMARLLAEETGAHALYAYRKSSTDPNWDAETPYKEFLAEVAQQAGIRFVLDLHGAGAKRPFGLGLGTMHGASCPGWRDWLIEELARSGFGPEEEDLYRLDVDETFPAAAQATVTKYVWERLGIPAAQIEINARLLIVRRFKDATREWPFRGNPTDIERTIQALVALVRAIQQRVER